MQGYLFYLVCICKLKYIYYLPISDDDDVSVIENCHCSCSLQEGEWPDQGKWQAPGDGGACYSPVQAIGASAAFGKGAFCWS